MEDKMLRLDDVVIVQVDVNSSALSANLSREDDLAGAALPPKDLASAGVKHYVNPVLKRPFNAIRKEVERACGEVGVPMLRGWAVPRHAAKALAERLKEFRAKFNAEADSLESGFDAEAAAWEQEHPDWVDMLRRGRPSAQEVRQRYAFRHRMYVVAGAGGDLDEEFGITHEGVLGALLDDVAKRAQEMLVSFEGRAQVPRCHVAKIAALGEKFVSFSFIDPSIDKAAALVADVVAGVSLVEGSLSVSDTSAMRGLLSVLAKPASVRKHCAASAGEPEALDLPIDFDQQEVNEAPQPKPVVAETPWQASEAVLL